MNSCEGAGHWKNPLVWDGSEAIAARQAPAWYLLDSRACQTDGCGMPKSQDTSRIAGRKASGHGGFKHTAKPASLDAVLHAFGLKQTEYERSKAFVHKRVNKEPAHAN